jgi:hypothetical protein
VQAAVNDVPAPRASDLGFGSLGFGAGTANDDGDFGTTASGLVRRVPGAQRPVTELGNAFATAADEAPVDAAPSPDDVGSFLSNFSAGVARGLVESGRNPWEEST